MESLSKRKAGKASSKLKVEQVFVQRDEDSPEDEIASINNRTPRAKPAEDNKFNMSRRSRTKHNRYTQVNADELDGLIFDCKVPSVPGENEPILISSEAIVPQCRLCLRRVSQTNLKVIFNQHKAKVLSAFRLKIYVNDSYPFACRNCLNLIDIFLDFRQIVMMSKNLLLTKKAYLENDGWDESKLMETIENCKAAVEQNRKSIEVIYEKYAKTVKLSRTETVHRNEEVHAKVERPDTIPGKLHTQVDEINPKIEISEEQLDTFNAVEIAEVQLFGSAESETDLKQENDAQFSGKESDNDYDMNDANDQDYTPEIRQLRSNRLTRKSDSNDSSGEDDDAGSFDLGTKKKKRKKQSKPKLGRKPKFLGLSEEQKQQMIWDYKHQLCDFCGETVTATAAEAHKNRHLGIKPYTCPVTGCEMTFHSKINQTTHVKRLHSEKGLPTLECNICGQFIRGDLRVLNYHKKRHTQEKKHVCTVCGKGFTMKCYLRQHSIVHSGEFPHKCSYCGKRFNNKWSMKTHEKNIHEKKNNFPVDQYPTTSSYNTSWDQHASITSEDQYVDNGK